VRLYDPLCSVPLRAWQRVIVSELTQEYDGRTVVWVADSLGGAGKTGLCRHLLLTRTDVQYVTGGKGADIAYVVSEKCRVLLLDLPRQAEGKISYAIIEQAANGMIFSPKYESRLKIMLPIRVYIFANWLPDLSQLSADRWDVRSLGTSDLVLESV